MAITQRNPRGSSGFDELLPFLAVGAAYVAARNGILGNDIRSQVLTLEARLRGGAVGAISAGGGGGGGIPSIGGVVSGIGGAGPAGGPCAAPPMNSFGGGQGHFVEAAGDGTFRTVINDRVIFTGTQAAAESAYRRAFGCPS